MCISDDEFNSVISSCHDQAYKGHLSGKKVAIKFFNMVSISLLCLGMFFSIARIVLGVNSWAELVGKI